MALIVGDIKDRTGLVGALADAVEAEVGARNFSEEDAEKGLKPMAEAIVGYILANAEFSISGSDSSGDSPGTYTIQIS